MRRAGVRSGRRSTAWLPGPGSPPDVGLVVAAATAPGTFASSLSPRSPLDQGLVTGLSTGLHFLLSVGAQDALVATSRVLVGGSRSPAAQRAGTMALDCAAVDRKSVV